MDELTLQAVYDLKQRMISQWTQLGKEKDELTAKVAAINARRTALKATYDALEVDVDDPTPSEPE